MKIIDLLNKIAKGEEVPKKIKYNGIIYNYVYRDTIQGSYDYDSYEGYLMKTLEEQKYLSDIINTEIEIIEEVEDKEYEDITLLREEYIEEFENMSGEKQQYIIKTLMEIALKKM